jgi:hypothetical protein
MQVLALVLVSLFSVGAPFAQMTLRPEAQALLTVEYSTLGLGLIVLIIQKRKG